MEIYEKQTKLKEDLQKRIAQYKENNGLPPTVVKFTQKEYETLKEIAKNNDAILVEPMGHMTFSTIYGLEIVIEPTFAYRMYNDLETEIRIQKKSTYKTEDYRNGYMSGLYRSRSLLINNCEVEYF